MKTPIDKILELIKQAESRKRSPSASPSKKKTPLTIEKNGSPSKKKTSSIESRKNKKPENDLDVILDLPRPLKTPRNPNGVYKIKYEEMKKPRNSP